MKKTNVMRLLDSKKIDYIAHSYDIKDDLIDGISVAKKIGRPLDSVYKTLVCQSREDYYVFVIPVNMELDLKKGARAVGEKSISLLAVKEINDLTGYIRGGCSPIGMKKSFLTTLPIEARERDRIIVSGGQIGSQIELKAEDLAKFIRIQFKDII